jgi:UDP:flavonoid glycosyltransferase YjiC (YdhE family)
MFPPYEIKQRQVDIMARLLFFPMSWGRGMCPLIDCLSVAREAAIRGHEVAFVCRDRFAALVSQEGFRIYKNFAPPAPQAIDSLFNSDFPAFQGLDNESWVRRMIKYEIAALRDFRPDAAFTWLQLTAAISTKHIGVPTVSVARWTGHPEFTSPLLGGQFPESRCTPLFNRILAQYGLSRIDDIWELDFIRSEVKVVPGVPELEPDLASVPDLYYVGHLLPSNPKQSNDRNRYRLVDWPEESPTVFVYLSSKQYGPQEYVPILREAFLESEFRAIVAVGLEDVCPELPESTTNVRFVRWVPIDAMMSISDVVISTGTRGTAWQAALHGAANIMFPGRDPERDFVAQMIENANAGKKLLDEDFTPKRLLGSAREVLNSDARFYAKELGDQLRALGGSRVAADLLIELSSGGSSDSNSLIFSFR